MTVLRVYAALTAVPALLSFAPGTAAAAQAAAPDTLQVGSETVRLPAGIDPRLRDQAQSYLDGVQGQIAATFDSVGFPRDEAARRNAATTAGQVIGAVVGKVAVFPLEIVGCGVGAAVGAVAGGIIGALPTVGAGTPVGAAVGGVAGCLLGGLAVAIPVDIAGLVGGAAIGGFAGGALGAATATEGAGNAAGGENPAAAALPVVNARAAQGDPLTANAVTAVADTVATINVDANVAVTSLRTAIRELPPLTPDALGPLTQPANDLFAAVQAAL